MEVIIELCLLHPTVNEALAPEHVSLASTQSIPLKSIHMLIVISSFSAAKLRVRPRRLNSPNSI